MGLSSITSRLLLQCTRLQRQLWSTLRQHKVMSYAAPAQVLMYLAQAPAACAAPIFTAIGAFGSLLSSPPSAPAPVVDHIASIPAVYAAPVLVTEYIALHQQCTLHLHLWWSQRAGFSSYAAPAPAVEYITSAQSVSYAAPVRVLSTLCQRLYPMLLIATAIGGSGSLPVEPTVYIFTCGGIHRDGTIGIRGTWHHQCLLHLHLW